MKDLSVNAYFSILLILCSCSLTQTSLSTDQFANIRVSKPDKPAEKELLNAGNENKVVVADLDLPIIAAKDKTITESYHKDEASSKASELSKNLQSIETFKAKVEVLKSKIEKQIPSNELEKYFSVTSILGSNRLQIVYLIAIVLFLMLILVLRISFFRNKEKSQNALHESTMKTSNYSTYYFLDALNLNRDVNLNESYKDNKLMNIELRGRGLKIPSVEAMCYNLNYKPTSSSLIPFAANTVHSNSKDKYFNKETLLPLEKFNTVNFENKMIQALKSNIPCYQKVISEIQLGELKESDKSLLYSSFAKINYDNPSNYNNTPCEFSFGPDTSQTNIAIGIGGKFNLNDTVDLEEREEYANIIDYLEH